MKKYYYLTIIGMIVVLSANSMMGYAPSEEEKKIDKLINELRIKNNNVRMKAAYALVEIGSEKAIKPLKALKEYEAKKDK
jgi:HEAT repeat protein